MSRILEALPFDFLHNIDLSEKRNKLASIISGFFFFSGWWFALDASATYHQDTRDVFHLCGVFATISMFMVNAVSNSLLRGEVKESEHRRNEFPAGKNEGKNRLVYPSYF